MTEAQQQSKLLSKMYCVLHNFASMFVLLFTDGGAPGDITKKRPPRNLHRLERERIFLRCLRMNSLERVFYVFFASRFIPFYCIFLEYYYLYLRQRSLSPQYADSCPCGQLSNVSPPLDEPKVSKKGNNIDSFEFS